MKPIDSSARTLSLIGLSILVHSAAFWAFNENLSLKQVVQIVQETRAQANKSEIWEKLSQNSQEVEIAIAPASAEKSDEFEFKKVESVVIEEDKKDENKRTITKKVIAKPTAKPVATELPEKEVIQESAITPLPKTTVNVAEESGSLEPENLEPEIRLIPASQWIDTDESTEASAKIEKTPSEIAETDLLSELRESEPEETPIEKIRSYLGLRQASGNQPPRYPLEARQQGLQGRVLLKYFVTEKGSVEDIKVAESSGYKILDDEAVRAISSYRFYPGQSGWAEHPVKFSLKGLSEDIPAELGAANRAN